MNVPTNKCLIVGDISVGKTSLTSRLITGVSPDPTDTIPDVHEVHSVESKIGERVVALLLTDTGSSPDSQKLYEHAAVVFICFAINDVTSFDHVKSQWLDVVRSHTKSDVPIFLVGCKSDLRAEEGHIVVENRTARALATEIGAINYIETSSYTGKGTKELIDEATQASFPKKVSKPLRYKCILQ
ncbi:P-loop containing nucleoside triphosphate hydrolase protein [Scheffersomyces amazonensis]|uniref:P-loop containing nucleoside triphosphate hydrolase protein n=1 Tax=Scheffersomyces amazonensis TaxID=1078765 RepID=UPI00315DA5F8